MTVGGCASFVCARLEVLFVDDPGRLGQVPAAEGGGLAGDGDQHGA